MTDARLELNSFTMSPILGQVAMDTGAGSPALTVQLKSTYVSTALAAGTPLKLDTSTGVLPQVDVATPGTDTIFGILLFDQKINAFAAGDVFQSSEFGSILYLKSGQVLSRGASVGLDPTYNLKAANNKNYIGILLDNATVGGYARVQIQVPISAGTSIS